ncbi:hypothetical protein IFR05_000506 [Cadophora sp. M221]|nr:hypothetical protein IFR05_000506 [Cadophora sp. M221]
MGFINPLSVIASLAGGIFAVPLLTSNPAGTNVIKISADEIASPNAVGFVPDITRTPKLNKLENRGENDWYLLACFDLNFTGRCLNWAAPENYRCYDFFDDWQN